MIHRPRPTFVPFARGVAIALLAASCKSEPVGPKTEYDGIRYTALGVGAPMLVQMENLTAAPVQRTYPSGCAVRIRLYRPIDGRRVYDETLWPCVYNAPVTILIQPGGTYRLSSGARNGFLGDSLPAATYIQHGVVMTEGSTPVEVNAGTVSLTYGVAGQVISPGLAPAVSFGPGSQGQERAAKQW